MSKNWQHAQWPFSDLRFLLASLESPSSTLEWPESWCPGSLMCGLLGSTDNRWLCKFKSIEKKDFSSLVTVATFQVLVATMASGSHVGQCLQRVVRPSLQEVPVGQHGVSPPL